MVLLKKKIYIQFEFCFIGVNIHWSVQVSCFNAGQTLKKNQKINFSFCLFMEKWDENLQTSDTKVKCFGFVTDLWGCLMRLWHFAWPPLALSWIFYLLIWMISLISCNMIVWLIVFMSQNRILCDIQEIRSKMFVVYKEKMTKNPMCTALFNNTTLSSRHTFDATA